VRRAWAVRPLEQRRLQKGKLRPHVEQRHCGFEVQWPGGVRRVDAGHLRAVPLRSERHRVLWELHHLPHNACRRLRASRAPAAPRPTAQRVPARRLAHPAMRRRNLLPTLRGAGQCEACDLPATLGFARQSRRDCRMACAPPVVARLPVRAPAPPPHARCAPLPGAPSRAVRRVARARC